MEAIRIGSAVVDSGGASCRVVGIRLTNCQTVVLRQVDMGSTFGALQAVYIRHSNDVSVLTAVVTLDIDCKSVPVSRSIHYY